MSRLPQTAALVALGFLSWASPAGAKGKVLAGGGCARSTADSSCKDVGVGALLPAQSTLVAGKDGVTIALDDRSSVRLLAGGEIRLLPRTKLQLGKGDTPAEVLQLLRGKAFAELASAGALLIKGPQQNAAVLKKGSGLVKVADDTFLLAMLQGSGVLGSGSDFNDVSEGYVRVIRKGDKPAYRALLRAPSSSVEPPVLLQVGPSGPGARLSWGALPGAEAYEIEVRSARGTSLKKMPKTSEQMPLDGLDGGDHEVRVRGVDGEDLEGPWSASHKFSVVGIDLPPGASFHGNAVQLPEKGKVKLRASSEMEVSFAQLTTFVPAPGEVGLAQGKAQTLRLRRRGETQEVRLLLIPRSYQARVVLSPNNARWPQDAIVIDIDLVSGNGMPAPSDVEMVPRVTLDQEVLTPSWSREGGRLRATIAPRGDKKPHVLRVEVSDQHGFPLGRNFLEVAAGPPR
jgi:hypothetical protein